jgi:hypothetical protein
VRHRHDAVVSMARSASSDAEDRVELPVHVRGLRASISIRARWAMR